MTPWAVLVRGALTAWGVTLVASCGAGDDDVAVGDTNTNWLKECKRDAQCGSEYSCMCGHCSIACERDEDCLDENEAAVCRASAGGCRLHVQLCALPTDDALSAGDAGVRAAPENDEAGNGELPEISGFTSSESSLPGGGGNATLSWSVSGAESLILKNERTSQVIEVGREAEVVSVVQTTNYTLVASNAEGFVESTLSVEVSTQGILDWTAGVEAGINQANDIAVDDAGGVFVVGQTQSTSKESTDGFVASYDALSGEPSWEAAIATAADDIASAVAVDAEGSLYVVGVTEGALNDTVIDDADPGDAFIVKYSAGRTLEWTKLFGGAGRDAATSIAINADGSISVGGLLGATAEVASRGFVARYSPAGKLRWLRELGSGEGTGTQVTSVSPTGSQQALVAVGLTGESLSGDNLGLEDAFVARLSSSGELEWITQFGSTEGDRAKAVVVDTDEQSFVLGESYGGLGESHEGSADVYLAKYSAAGAELWMRHLATSGRDLGEDLAIDGSGNVLVVGVTGGALDGANLGDDDVFISKYRVDGDALWTRQFGSEDRDSGFGIAVDRFGNAFVAGFTVGAFGSTPGGERESFVMRVR